MKAKNNPGFSLIEGLMIVIVVAIIGTLGYAAWHTMHADKHEPTPTATSSVETPAQPINNKSDLDAAEKTLNSTDLNDSNLDQASQQASL